MSYWAEVRDHVGCLHNFRYDDDVQSGISPRAGGQGRSRFHYRPARFPTRNIRTPTVLLYGTADSLVDIDVMLRQLPDSTRAIPLRGYEHVDILWGEHVDRDVIPEVLSALKTNSREHLEIPLASLGDPERKLAIGRPLTNGNGQEDTTDFESE